MINFACILAGGLGTRLRSLYSDRPKALVPICGRPFIEHLVLGLMRQGINRLHIAAGYRADQIKDWVETQTIEGVRITVSVEPEPLGTGGGLKFAYTHCPQNQPLLVLNGDSLLPRAEVQQLETIARQHPPWKAVIAVVEMTERGQYGTVEVDNDNHITAFREKSTNDRGWVNGGIYYLDPAIINAIPDHVVYSMEKDVFPSLAGDGKLGAMRTPGPLLDMGTPEGLEKTTAYMGTS